MAVPLMHPKALLEIIGAINNYLDKKPMVFDESKFYKVQDELLASGLDMHEAEMMLMHTGTIYTFRSEMNKVLAIFEKVATFHNDRAKKTELLETKKKELEEAQALVATKIAELAELQKVSGP